MVEEGGGRREGKKYGGREEREESRAKPGGEREDYHIAG